MGFPPILERERDRGGEMEWGRHGCVQFVGLADQEGVTEGGMGEFDIPILVCPLTQIWKWFLDCLVC
ncbi:hypothetical protein C1H46_043905 [Malus baccata]|uniref:Uncharacterized protein n=1 Tax=Malus baccata TaxID=106549 RepID=A0A540K8M0_MALBA|nr:hypothetical protein C1H46_043905 [Malus baccata]